MATRSAELPLRRAEVLEFCDSPPGPCTRSETEGDGRHRRRIRLHAPRRRPAPYNGPWVAERTAAVGAFLEETHEGAGVCLRRQIILGGRAYSAVDAFEGQHELVELKAAAAAQMAGPISRRCRRRARFTPWRSCATSRSSQRASWPLHQLRNFSACRLALPSGFRPDGLPFGITLVAGAHAERALLARQVAAGRLAAARQDRLELAKRANDPVVSRTACRSPWSART